MGVFDTVPKTEKAEREKARSLFSQAPLTEQQAELSGGIVPPEPPAATPTVRPAGRLEGAVDMFTQGVVAGQGQKLTAHEAAILGRTPEGGWFDYSKPYGERYDRALTAERAQQDRFRTDHPVTATASEVGGILYGAGKLNRLGLSASSHAARAKGFGSSGVRAGAAAADGAALGAAYAHGEGRNVAESALYGGAFSMGSSAIVDAGLRPVANALRRRQLAKSARTSMGVKAEKDQLYSAFDKEDVVVGKDVGRRLLSDIDDRLSRAAADTDNAPSTLAMRKRLSDRVDNPNLAGLSLRDLEARRQALGRMTRPGGNNPNDSHAAGEVKAAISRMYADLKQNDVVAGGDVAKAAEAIASARKAHQAYMKARTLDEVFNKAQGGYASGDANGIRLGLRSILREAGKTKGSGPRWTQAELSAMRDAADGGPLDSLLYMAGRFGFATGNSGQNSLGAGLGAMAGYGGGSLVEPFLGAMAAPASALGAMVLTTGARRLSDARIHQRAAYARALINGQINAPPPGATQRLLGNPELGRAVRHMGLAAGVASSP